MADGYLDILRLGNVLASDLLSVSQLCCIRFRTLPFCGDQYKEHGFVHFPKDHGFLCLCREWCEARVRFLLTFFQSALHQDFSPKGVYRGRCSCLVYSPYEQLTTHKLRFCSERLKKQHNEREGVAGVMSAFRLALQEVHISD